MKTPTKSTDPKTKLLFTATPYQLKGQLPTSDSFYALLDLFAEKVTDKGFLHFSSIIKRYRASLAYLNNNLKQSTSETLLDLLMLAVLWNEYQGCSGRNIQLKDKTLSLLFAWRTKFPEQKERLDRLRGRLAQKWIDRPSEETEISQSNVKMLTTWLSATNEYNQEVLRFKSWIQFLENIPEAEVKDFLIALCYYGDWFRIEAKQALGPYTYGVNSFLKNHREKYFKQENFFFTGKKEVEYHLNMVGAAIMNRSMQAEFDETEHKVLLLPACMKKNKDCQAVDIMNGTVCRHCDPECNISKASTEMLSQGVHTFIVKHSSGFSSYLKQWEGQNKVGLIGTACTLNLLQGGLEMKKLNIPAQCIFLEYSGCQKHWTSQGIPTNINRNRLKSMVEVEKSKAV